ncbi:MAG: tyrosine-type recombinase/integrase, partial [Methanomicrobiaceae archaeon]|nr:tyrosine-type recombinase/integrase [Methanomicrobiaceae archaeon]
MNDVAPTTADSSFHLIKSHYSDRSIEKGLATGRLTQQDAALIREFVFELQSSIDISIGRTNKLVYSIVGWRRFIGPFTENTITDLFAGIGKLKAGKNEKGRPFKQNTISDLIAILKQFYRWLIENEYSAIPEKKLQKIKVPVKDPMTKEASDLLSPSQITDLMNACIRSIDRALIMTMYEGGFRVGELGKMAWKDIVFDDHGVVVNVNFKTNKPRYVRLVMAREHLAKWRSDYPFLPEGNNLVFINERRKPLMHGSIIKQLDRIGERAGIKKHLTPHIFRHSRITHLIREGVSESVIKLMMWGTINSKMFHTYAHLTGNDIDNEILNT